MTEMAGKALENVSAPWPGEPFPPWLLLSREDEEAEMANGGYPIERRRYPPPDLEMGVVQAAKIAGILMVPMSVVAGLFAVYLQGFRSDIRLDMQKVVTEAVDKHVEGENKTYATLTDAASIQNDVANIKQDVVDLKRDMRDNTKLLQELARRSGIK